MSVLEVPFRTSRRTLLSFLGTAAFGTPVANNLIHLPDMNDGLVVLNKDTKPRSKYEDRFDNVPHMHYDVQPGVLYDTVVFSPGSITPRSIEFFTNVGVNTGKYWEDTNLTCSRRLNAPEQFSADTMFMQTLEANHSFKTICENYALHLWIGSKCFYRGPIPLLANIFNSNDLDGSEAHAATFSEPLLLHHNHNFHVELLGNPVTIHETVRMYFHLKGLHLRAIL